MLDIIIFSKLFSTIISKVLTVMIKRWGVLKLKTDKISNAFVSLFYQILIILKILIRKSVLSDKYCNIVPEQYKKLSSLTIQIGSWCFKFTATIILRHIFEIFYRWWSNLNLAYEKSCYEVNQT